MKIYIEWAGLGWGGDGVVGEQGIRVGNENSYFKNECSLVGTQQKHTHTNIIHIAKWKTIIKK